MIDDDESRKFFSTSYVPLRTNARSKNTFFLKIVQTRVLK